MGKMNQETAAITIRSKDLELNSEALSELVAFASTPTTAVDIRYGLGGWAKIIREQFPNCSLLGFEMDADTARAAWKDRMVNLVTRRFSPTDKFLSKQVDLLLADFNITTVKNRALLDEAITLQPSEIIFTDVACVKLHLNYRSYGLEEPDLDAYWSKFSLPKYGLVKWAKKHHAASTALFKRIN